MDSNIFSDSKRAGTTLGQLQRDKVLQLTSSHNSPAALLQRICRWTPFQQHSDQGNSCSFWQMPTTTFHESQSEMMDVNSRTCNVLPWGYKRVYGHSLRISYPLHTEGALLPNIPTSLCCWPGANFPWPDLSTNNTVVEIRLFHPCSGPKYKSDLISRSPEHHKFPLKSRITTRFSTSENEDMYTLRWLGTDLEARLKIWPANFTFQQTASYL